MYNSRNDPPRFASFFRVYLRGRPPRPQRIASENVMRLPGISIFLRTNAGLRGDVDDSLGARGAPAEVRSKK